MKNNHLGMERVKDNAGIVYITQSHWVEYMVKRVCNLAMLKDTRALNEVNFAIAVQKGSPHLEAFNKAIRELKQDGTIQQLRDKYWADACVRG